MYPQSTLSNTGMTDTIQFSEILPNSLISGLTAQMTMASVCESHYLVVIWNAVVESPVSDTLCISQSGFSQRAYRELTNIVLSDLVG